MSMSVLEDLLVRLRDAGDGEERNGIIAAAVQTDTVDLSALSDALREKSGAVDVEAEGFDPSPEQLEYLTLLSAVGAGVNAEITRRDEEAALAKRRLTAAKLAAQIASTRKPDAETAEAAEDEEDGGEAAAAGAAKASAKAPVTAGAAKRPAVPTGRMRSTTPDRRPVLRSAPLEGTIVNRGIDRVSIVASSDGPGIFSGQELPTLSALTAAVRDKLAQTERIGSRDRVSLATIKRHAPSEFLIEDEMRDWHKLENIADETRLPGGSLVAAVETRREALTAAGAARMPVGEPNALGGALHAWCSPMDILDGWCPLQMDTSGFLDLPTITTTKGGVMWPKTPDYGKLFESQPFCFTYDDMQDKDGKFEKPCIEVPCDPGWEQCILDACSFCMIDNVLLSRIDDSLNQRAIAWGLYLMRRKLNADRLAAMQKIITAEGGEHTVTAAELACHGPGMTESILSYLDLVATHLRLSRGLGENTTFEVVAPRWLLKVFVADLSKKLGIENRWTIGEAQVAAWLAQRGLRFQAVTGFGDSTASDAKPGDLGGSTFPTCWPDKVKIMLYQTGAFQAVQGPSVQLDAIYDSTLLKKNKRVRLFVEDMHCLIHRCGVVSSFEFPLCPNGLSGGGLAVDCDGKTISICGEPAPPPENGGGSGDATLKAKAIAGLK